jgi:hypothetical protein
MAELEKVVYKYILPLEHGDKHDVKMPVNARILHVGMQGNNICIWALVWPLITQEERYFQIVGTGHLFDATGKVHIGSVQHEGFVWHVFEKSSH